MSHRFPVPPVSWSDSKEHLRKLSLSVRDILKGRTNNTEDVTLTADATTTEVNVDGVTTETLVTFAPRTASAAAAMDKVWSSATLGVLTIHHDADPATDRSFGIILTG